MTIECWCDGEQRRGAEDWYCPRHGYTQACGSFRLRGMVWHTRHDATCPVPVHRLHATPVLDGQCVDDCPHPVHSDDQQSPEVAAYFKGYEAGVRGLPANPPTPDREARS